MNTDLITAWCAIITVGGGIFGVVFRYWSKRQDAAINGLQKDVNRLKYHGVELRRYIRRLLLIMHKHDIDYPTPPDSFYDDTLPPGLVPPINRSNNEQR